MLHYIGWILAAFLSGVLLALWYILRSRSVRENFARVECYQGRSYREILAIAGTSPAEVAQRDGGNTLRTWKAAGYSISLLFDGRDICLGVEDERV